MMGFICRLVARTVSFQIYNSLMQSRPYGAPRPAICEELKIRTVHRGLHCRINTYIIRKTAGIKLVLYTRICSFLSDTAPGQDKSVYLNIRRLSKS